MSFYDKERAAVKRAEGLNDPVWPLRHLKCRSLFGYCRTIDPFKGVARKEDAVFLKSVGEPDMAKPCRVCGEFGKVCVELAPIEFKDIKEEIL